MARTRTGKKLLDKTSQTNHPFHWLQQRLADLGRLVYKLPYFFGRWLISGSKALWSALIKKRVGKQPALKKPLISLNRKKAGLFLSLFLLGVLSLSFYKEILSGLPRPNKLITRNQAVSTKIYDRNGTLLFTIFDGSQNRSLVQLSEIPQTIKWATLAIEDQNFYQHSGFSLVGIVRAVIRNLSSSKLEGGSTITQQLIKNALLSPEKTFKRKLKEVILSIQTELVFSKDEILQMYFNEVPYGGTAYGVEEAAQTYFGKSVKEVNLAEAALLAGLPAAPTKYSPFGANPRLCLARQHQVLDKMVEQNYISPAAAQAAKKEKIVLAPRKNNLKAPHFVMYVKDQLVKKYPTRQIEQGGLQVTTTLDLDLQQKVQTIVRREVAELASLRVGNGAALVTNPKTGEILAMVGSRDYFDPKEDGNVNVTTAPRQPGSAIKVITYALALTNGFTPSTIINDTPVTYYSPGAPAYSPVNYDRGYHGAVTLRTALASSYNVPAVKTLASLGVNQMIDLARKMGITTWRRTENYGLALTLGSSEVKMTDMAVVYGSLANLGLKQELQAIKKITNSQGKILYQAVEESDKPRVLSPQVAYLLTDILKDNQARKPAFGPNSLLVIPNHQVAVKTGTTNDKRDNWTIGYTSDRLVAVWVGNNDNTPMSAVASGVTGASPIWHKIFTYILNNKPSHKFEPPDNLIQLEVCSLNGLLPCSGCPTVKEYFIPGTEPKYHCSTEQLEEAKQENQAQDRILEGISTGR